MIRAAVDLRPLGRQATGIGTYLTALLLGLAARPADVGVTGLSFSLRRPLPPPAWWPERWPWRVGRLPWRFQRSAWPRLAWPPVSRWTGPADLFHATSVFIPPEGRLPLVVTVHDVGFLRLPGVRPPEMTTAVERAFMAALRRADAIVADSAFTAREAAEATGIDAARFRVVHCALPPAAPATPHDAGEPYLLALGTAEPRKNLAVLIEAWGILAGRGKPPLLLICGSCDTPEGERLRATVARLGLAGRVRFLGFSPQAQVRSLLAGASGLLFPSRYEGFGYPLLEAFREGCPVAAADAGSLPEIGGPAVLLLPPDDPAAWADTASALVAADAATRGRLVAAGRTRLAAFGLDAMAAGHLAAYQEAV